MGVPPWTLLDVPRYWTEWALAYEAAMNQAQQTANEQAHARGRMRT